VVVEAEGASVALPAVFGVLANEGLADVALVVELSSRQRLALSETLPIFINEFICWV